MGRPHHCQPSGKEMGQTHGEGRVEGGGLLAHGLEPIAGRSAQRFLEYVDVMVDQPVSRAAAKHAQLEEL